MTIREIHRMRYYIMINDALDAIPMKTLSDFGVAIEDLKKIIGSALESETPDFHLAMRDSMETIYEFYSRPKDYVMVPSPSKDETLAQEKADEYQKNLSQYRDDLKIWIQTRIVEFDALPEIAKYQYMSAQKTRTDKAKQDSQRIAACQSKRARHADLMKKSAVIQAPTRSDTTGSYSPNFFGRSDYSSHGLETFMMGLASLYI